MQQIADWLEKLGMPEYTERFAANDIDFSILPELTDQDLEKIGVASLGHRRKILRAIAAFASAPATVVPPALSASSSSPNRLRPSSRRRRRLLPRLKRPVSAAISR